VDIEDLEFIHGDKSINLLFVARPDACLDTIETRSRVNDDDDDDDDDDDG